MAKAVYRAGQIPEETIEFFRGDELRIRCFLEKYALKDLEGNTVERTPIEMWKRVAKELASVEEPKKRKEWEKKFYWLLEDFRFIPGGRIMFGAGQPRRATLLNCFPAGTSVLTRDGLKPIEQIRPAEEVLTHRNRFRPVTRVLRREVEEPLRVIKLWYLGDQPIKVTKEHRFLCFDGTKVDWVEAKHLTPAHYVKVGRIEETLPQDELDLADYVSEAALEDEDGRLYTVTSFVGGQGAVGVKESKRVSRKIAVDERFGLWLGLFVAEGGVTEHSVYFTFSKDEEPYAEAVCNLTQQLFGIEAVIQRRIDQEGHWLRVYVHSKLMVEFVKAFFQGATRSYEKQLPPWFLTAPRAVQKAFIAGLFLGDGVVREDYVKLFLANPPLMRQVFLILLRLGIVASIRWEGILQYTRHRGMWIHIGTQRYVEAIRAWLEGDWEVEATLEESPMNHFYKVVDGDLFVKVKACDWTPVQSETVYDLSVEEDHSFVAEFAVAHNCYVIPIKEDSIEGIFEWCKEAARTYSFGGGVGTDISILRPKGSPVNNSAIYSSGSVSFMDLFSTTTGTIGQCLARGTRVLTQQGWCPIETLRVGAHVWTHLGWKPVTFIFPKRRQKVLRLTTKMGYQIIASYDHKFAVPSPEGLTLKPLRELGEGDRIVLLRGIGLPRQEYLPLQEVFYKRDPSNDSNRLKGIRQPEVLTPQLAYLLGYYFGDGSTYLKKGVRGIKDVEFSLAVSDSKPEILLHLRQSISSIFGIEPRVKGGDGALQKIVFHSKWLHLFLQANGLLKPHSNQVRIPEIIRSSPDEVLIAFLAGYFDADGYASGPKKGYVYSTTSSAMAEDLRHELLRLGIAVKTSREERVSWHDLYQVAVVGASAQCRFVSSIGRYSLKVQGIKHISKRDAILTPFTSRTLGIRYNRFPYVPDPSQQLSVATLERYAEETGTDLEGANLFIQDEIACLEPLGEEETYDIEVAEAHKFVAGGFYVSNSGRRGALMITISVDHPDVLDFIEIKNDPARQKVRYANISVRVTDEFMRAVEKDEEFTLRYENDVIGRWENKVKARQIWEKLIKNAWASAEPGVIFWDNIKRESTTEYNGMEVHTVNPCAEISLEPYGCCCLGNINLSSFVLAEFTESAKLDWPNLERALRYATRFLDNVLDYNASKHPLPAQKEASLKSRRIGVGFTGFGDMLIKLGLKYDTDEAIKFTDQLFEHIKNIVYDESTNLAFEKGTFPAFDLEKHLKCPFVQRLDKAVLNKIKAQGLRNAALLTVPPVGSGSVLAGVTSGIEPIFSLSYVRRSESLSKEEFQVYHPLVREYLRRFKLSDVKDLPNMFVTAHEIKPEMRVRMQATIQKHIDHALSSTVNLPKDISPEEVGRIYFLAWKSGCKGITVYREGSREGVLLTEEEAKERGRVAASSRAIRAPRPRPKVVRGKTYRMKTELGTVFVTVNEDEQGLAEVFVWMSKSGSSSMAFTEAIGRLISLALRSGVKPSAIIDQLILIRGARPVVQEDGTVVFSVPDAIAKAMEEYLKGGEQLALLEEVKPKPFSHSPSGLLKKEHDHKREIELCPNCGGLLIFSNGCYICSDCGFSECD